ncbi:hypothetical protein SUGI_0867090 [Cryptomeria japonica]|uniref:uncharacterized protein LOC131071758 n=1 Tax=Cryptomeria japonica TaxID=3369 RepID=UPI002414A970|nr:uncharacterized protein LOC131071758 [Cryptomeria japonica]GLJ41876.1 hypothetical protein SUGI_0867090 [Cryptomeria japonica]
MPHRKREMAYFKKDEAESGQTEGSASEAESSEQMRGRNSTEITRDEQIFKIGHISESSCAVSVSCTANVLDEPNCSIVDCIPTHLTSVIDFSGSTACSTNYVHGGRILGKAAAVALQVPSSPLLGSSLTGSAVVTSSRAFFPPLGNAESRLSNGNFGSCAVASSVVECSMPAEPRLDRGSGQNGDNRVEAQVSSGSRRVSIAQRLTQLFQGTEDEDLLLQQSDGENEMLQWLQALDLQVMGACRADERLRPMLQLNVSCSGADDRLLAQLSQHFKARELGMLVRCLCVPLVSIRVGKVAKQGHLLCPTSSRGHLSLTLLPCSDLRLSFVGDNGGVERLAILSPGNENSNVVVEEISADVSGRSFLLKLPGGKVAYFWQSEKSKLVGDELLSKMKDLLGRRPSLAQLTGIRESRLDSFATYLRTSFLGSASSSTQQGSASSLRNASRASSTAAHPGPSNSSDGSAPFLMPSQRFRLGLSQPIMHGRLHSGNQGSLSPRAGAFKDAAIRNVSCMRAVSSTREKLKRRMDGHSSNFVVGTPSIPAVQALINLENCNANVTDPERTEVSQSVTVLNSAEVTNQSFGNVLGVEHGTPLPQRYLHLPVNNRSGSPSQHSPFVGESSFDPFAFHLPVSSRVPIANSSIFAPHYCPCPLRPSSLQYTITTPFLPSLPTEAVSLPPATSYFSVGSSSAFIPPLPLDLHDVSFSPISLPVPSLVNIPTPLQTSNLPSFLSDPVVRVPLPVSSFVTVPTPQQMSTFTPFFSDPIVHIPMIDFDTTGQGYLVSAGPSISSAISPILPSLLSTLIPESGPLDEKEDTNTLQLLTRLAFSSPWRGSEGENCETNFMLGFPASTVRAGTSSWPLNQHQNGEEVSRSCLDTQMNHGEKNNSYNFCGVRSSNPGIQDYVHYGISSQQSGPIVGMAPALLTSSNLSCLFDICQDGKPKLTTLVTGSRGLYGGSLDPVVSSALLAGINQISAVHSDTNLNCLVRNNLIGTQNEDSLVLLEDAFAETEGSNIEKIDKEESLSRLDESSSSRTQKTDKEDFSWD